MGNLGLERQLATVYLTGLANSLAGSRLGHEPKSGCTITMQERMFHPIQVTVGRLRV